MDTAQSQFVSTEVTSFSLTPKKADTDGIKLQLLTWGHSERLLQNSKDAKYDNCLMTIQNKAEECPRPPYPLFYFPNFHLIYCFVGVEWFRFYFSQESFVNSMFKDIGAIVT